MVIRRRGLADVVQSGRVATGPVAEPGRTPRLVERDPSFDVVTERSRDEVDVLGESFGGVAHAPATRVLEGLWQVPVIEGDGGFDVAFEQSIDEASIEVEPALVGGTLTGGLDTWPRDRKAVRAHAELTQEIEVFAHTVVVIAGDVTGVAVPHGAGTPTEGVPDGWTSPVDGRGAFDLIRGGGGAPEKPWWEGASVFGDARARSAHSAASPHR